MKGVTLYLCREDAEYYSDIFKKSGLLLRGLSNQAWGKKILNEKGLDKGVELLCGGNSLLELAKKIDEKLNKS